MAPTKGPFLFSALQAINAVWQSALARNFLLVARCEPRLRLALLTQPGTCRLRLTLLAKAEACRLRLALLRGARHALLAGLVSHAMAASLFALSLPLAAGRGFHILALLGRLLLILLGGVLLVLLGGLRLILRLAGGSGGLSLSEHLPNDEQTGRGNKQCFLHGGDSLG